MKLLPGSRPLPLRVHSRVRVTSVTIRASDSPGHGQHLLKRLGTTGTIDSLDPRFTLPFRVRLDNGEITAFSEDELEPLAKQLALKDKEMGV